MNTKTKSKFSKKKIKIISISCKKNSQIQNNKIQNFDSKLGKMQNN